MQGDPTHSNAAATESVYNHYLATGNKPAPLRNQEARNTKNNQHEQKASWIPSPKNPIRQCGDNGQISYAAPLPPTLTENHQEDTSKLYPHE